MMQGDALEEWRQADKAALRAEDDARSAARAKMPDARELAHQARQLRKFADDLWRDCLGSSLAPLASVTAAPQSKPVADDRSASTGAIIDKWRRAQARAHAAEVKTVHAYMRFSQGSEEDAPFAWQAEASRLRGEAAARLQRVYEVLGSTRPEKLGRQ